MASGLPFKLAPGFTLDAFSRMAEEEDPKDFPLPDNLTRILLPPENATEDFTDEDSSEEGVKLLGSQLRAEVIITSKIADNVPNADTDKTSWKKKLATEKKPSISWKTGDLSRQVEPWPEVWTCSNNLSPTDLFSLFFDENVISLLTEQTNRFAAKNNKVGDVSTHEMRVFLAVLLLSGYVDLPRREMYWDNSEDTNNAAVTKSIARDRFEFILSNLHCSDNDQLDKADPFTKVRPLFDELNKRFQLYAPHAQSHNVGGTMIPYLGRHGCKQFIHGKPVRYGFKVWTGTTSYGYVLWMKPYQGAESIIKDEYKELGPSVVLQYSDVLLSLGKYSFHIFCDDFFSTVPLVRELSTRGVNITGTIREDRVAGCPMKSKEEMKRASRGDFDMKCCDGGGIVVVKWNDNNVVSVISNCDSVYPLKTVNRYSQKDKKTITIKQPRAIMKYNSEVGGVDRADQNISMYRISITGKKWYFSLLAHCIDVAEQNAWQLYRQQGGSLDHLSFRRRLALSLLESNRAPRKRERPSSLEFVDSRLNSLDHILVRQPKQTRCKVCHKKVLKKCEKCEVALHMECFPLYHTN